MANILCIGYVMAHILLWRWSRKDPVTKHEAHDSDPGSSHFDPRKERMNAVLGDLIKRVNHYAITVSDVAKSLSFYKNVLGLQQVKRPNFDRHGAWLTAGNMEIHLIKGTPTVADGDSLVASHLSLEVDVQEISEALRRLKEAKVPYQTNVSVPTAKEDGVVTQYFLRDPDGYYVEICNCDILTKFILSRDESQHLSYNETSVAIGMPEILRMHVVAEQARQRYNTRANEKPEDLVLPADQQAKFADVPKLTDMLTRTRIYGDIMQGEDTDTISRALCEAGNNVPLATRILRARKLAAGKTWFLPPVVYREGDEKYQPKPVEHRIMMLSKGDKEAHVVPLDTEDAIGVFKRIFALMDHDKTGSLTSAEALSAMKPLFPDISAKEVEQMFADYDTDRSGGIDESEFIEMCKTMLGATETKKWDVVFKLCDDDDNGQITLPELNSKLSGLGLCLGDDEMEELFLEVDEDGDGKISLDEFKAVMCVTA